MHSVILLALLLETSIILLFHDTPLFAGAAVSTKDGVMRI